MYDERLAERVRGVLAPHRSVVEKKMMGGLCFMLRGHMCCGVTKDQWVSRGIAFVDSLPPKRGR